MCTRVSAGLIISEGGQYSLGESERADWRANVPIDVPQCAFIRLPIPVASVLSPNFISTRSETRFSISDAREELRRTGRNRYRDLVRSIQTERGSLFVIESNGL
jgi:hypothetical protein